MLFQWESDCLTRPPAGITGGQPSCCEAQSLSLNGCKAVTASDTVSRKSSLPLQVANWLSHSLVYTAPFSQL